MDVIGLLDAACQQEEEITQTAKKAKLQFDAIQGQEIQKCNKDISQTLKTGYQQVMNKINMFEMKKIGLNHILNEILPKDYEKLVQNVDGNQGRSTQLQKQSALVLSNKSEIEILSSKLNELNDKIQSEKLLKLEMLEKVATEEDLAKEMIFKHNEELEMLQTHISDEVEKGNSVKIVEMQIVLDETAKLEKDITNDEEEMVQLKTENVDALNSLAVLQNELELITKEFDDLEQVDMYNMLKQEFEEKECLHISQTKQLDTIKNDLMSMRSDLYQRALDISHGFLTEEFSTMENFNQNCYLNCNALSQQIAESIMHNEKEIESVQLESIKLENLIKECLQSTESVKQEIQNIDIEIKAIESLIGDNALQSKKLNELQILIDEQQSCLMKLDAEISEFPERHNIKIKDLLEFISSKEAEINTCRDSHNDRKKNILRQMDRIDKLTNLLNSKQEHVDASTIKLQSSHQNLLKVCKDLTLRVETTGNKLAEKKVTFDDVVTEREITFESASQQTQDAMK